MRNHTFWKQHDVVCSVIQTWTQDLNHQLQFQVIMACFPEIWFNNLERYSSQMHYAVKVLEQNLFFFRLKNIWGWHQVSNISAFIFRCLHLDQRHNLEDSFFNFFNETPTFLGKGWNIHPFLSLLFFIRSWGQWCLSPAAIMQEAGDTRDSSQGLDIETNKTDNHSHLVDIQSFSLIQCSRFWSVGKKTWT